ncbi:ornithine decarboxylase-like isoform X2 [Mercenaria mercenaria]|uniref:ornithine decarboxylase-like isoform X2 n=1 Tax=Mercenaria mercenaria TaxID=6596 RepID=UPI00234EAFEB|nr:ornithine decarboxylase-like isoform X2 [Mercenaria mercenaria]XP_053394511.1 ornithine decarboxylase-like isoform X2 [Mercenaria mercenaria]
MRLMPRVKPFYVFMLAVTVMIREHFPRLYNKHVGTGMSFCMKLLDIGGGFPGQLNTYDTFHEITGVVNKSLQTYFSVDMGVEVIAEPGRYMVASAFTLGVQIIAKRTVPSTLSQHNKAECTNSAETQDSIMYYVNDGVYGTFLSKLSVGRKYEAKSLKADEDAVIYESSIWGPSCDSVDFLVESTQLPSHEVGEWLYFPDMGAYTLSSITKFNGMEEPKQIYYCLANTWYQVYKEEH